MRDFIQAKRSNLATTSTLSRRRLPSARAHRIDADSTSDGAVSPEHAPHLKYSLSHIPIFPLEPVSPASEGQSLPGPLRQKMERAFGQDFSSVHIHEDPQVRSIGTNAYTKGNHIYFAPGEYQPQRTAGQRLLGHELTHVVQQRLGRVPVHKEDGLPINTDHVLESEADALGHQASLNRPVSLAVSRSGYAPSGQGVMQLNGGDKLKKLKEKLSQGAKDIGARATDASIRAGTELIKRQNKTFEDFHKYYEANPGAATELGDGPAFVQNLALQQKSQDIAEELRKRREKGSGQ